MKPALFLATAALVSTLSTASALELQKGDRVCVVGNTFGERMQFSGYFETLLHARHADKEIVLRNLSWSADTLTLQPRPLNCPTQDQFLTQHKASVVVACYGLNESFETPMPQFQKDLEAFIDRIRSQKYDGTAPPRLVLISPVAHETLDRPGMPPARQRNFTIENYVSVMQGVCQAKKVEFVDIFHPLLAQYEKEPARKLTTNGIHLNEDGERFVSSEIDARLFGSAGALRGQWTGEKMETLRQAVNEKSRQFWLRYRPLNPFYIYGGRNKPFGEASFPAEMEFLDGMVANRDRKIWDIAQGKTTDLKVDDSNLKPLPAYPTTLPETKILTPDEERATFTMLDGFEVNLFASEVQFPELANPVGMTFDARGRMWLTTIPSFPHALPGKDPNDRVLILTDKDGDGKADEVKTFADKLYMPLALELGYGGAYVSQPPNLLYLRDTDGDDVADVRSTVLHGFGAEDSHHAISAFCWGPGGGLHMMEGTFLHSQVETPWGPQRLESAGVWRYEPAVEKLMVHVSYPYANPWGQTWDRWGRNTIADASGGDNHYGNAYSGWLPFPQKHKFMDRFTAQEAHVRPTAGCEVVSSRHWPDEYQGWWLLNNIIGLQGTRMFRTVDDGSGLKATEWKDLLRGKDTSFRPVDIEFGPDGALYIVDWYNPIVGHTTFSMRDPQRAQKYGRIWRITAKGRDLVKPAKIEGAKIPELLELLRTPEDRTRYRVRRELAQRDTPGVLAAMERFLKALPETDPQREHLLLECLWVQQWHHAVTPALLQRVLACQEPKARAAAVHVLRWWHDRIPDSTAMLKKAANDDYPAVRLEAVVAASFVHSTAGVEIALEAAKHSGDYYLDYAMDETLRALEPQWRAALAKGTPLAAENPKGMARLLRGCSNDELAALAVTGPVASEILRRDGMSVAQITAAAKALNEKSPASAMIAALPDARGTSLAQVLAASDSKELATAAETLTKLAAEAKSREVRTAALAALCATDDSKAALALVQENPEGFLALCDAVPLLPEALRAGVADKIAGNLEKLTASLAGKADAGLPVAARYVRIELPRKGTLSLTEVEVFSEGKNIALNGTAKQSSTALGGVASRAIDGGTHGEWGRATTTHTEVDEMNPWWELDLARVRDIERIAITNRNDYASDTGKRLDGFRLTLLDAARRPVFTHQHEAAAARIEIPVKTSAVPALRAAAIRAWGSAPGAEEKKFAVLLPQLAESEVQDAVIAALKGLDPSKAAPEAVAAAADALAAALPKVPLAARLESSFADAVAFAQNLAAKAPAVAGKLNALLAAEAPVPLALKADPLQLLYDQKELTAKAGSVVALTFENPGEQPHNVVIASPGSLEKIGAGADAIQTDPNALSRGFVPDIPEVLHKTRMLNRGEKETLLFRAPAEPGDYVIVCTFPGHWRLMQAVLKVKP
jgi:glucose/arabinose dehydrogenase/azurin